MLGIYILLGLLIILVLVLIILVIKNKTIVDSSNLIDPIKNELDRNSRNITQSNMLMKDKINEDYGNMILKLSNSLNELNEKIKANMKDGFKDTDETVKKLSERMAVIDESQKNIVSLVDQIKGLEAILGNNKETGNFGESLLDQVLFAYFGDDEKLYKCQYTIPGVKLKDGSAVKPDAVIFMPHDLLCIDSKFPVHFYQEYLNAKTEEDKTIYLNSLKDASRKQIDEIESKYIIKGKTSEYACMFIPSDSLVALLYKKLPALIDYARKKKIIILSPSTIIPFVSSLRVVHIDYERNKNVEKLYDSLVALSRQFDFFKNRWDDVVTKIDQLGKAKDQLNITSSHLNSEFEKINNMHLDEVNKE